jgi:hypothetical protein
VSFVIGLTFLPIARFSRCLVSNRSRCSLFKAARPERFSDKVRADTDVPPSTSIWGSAGSCLPHYLYCTGPPRRIGAWEISPSCGSNDRGTIFRPPGSPHSWPVYRNEFSSYHWAASGVGEHNCGCRVEGPLNLLRDRVWVVPCRGLPQRAGRRAVGVLSRTLG